MQFSNRQPHFSYSSMSANDVGSNKMNSGEPFSSECFVKNALINQQFSKNI